MDQGVFLEPQRIYGTPWGERDAWLKNSPALESFKKAVLELSSATFSSNVYHCILLVSLYVIHVILFVNMITIWDYLSAL